MLCPEIWNFPSPPYVKTRIQRIFWENNLHTSKIMKDLGTYQLNRTLSIVIPEGGSEFDHEIRKELKDGMVYTVRQFPIEEMLKKAFVEAFVRRGELYGVPFGVKMETDDCAAITPDGILIMSLTINTYESLGVNMSKCKRSREGDKYVVKIDLTSSIAKEQIRNVTIAFDMMLRWIPPTNDDETRGIRIAAGSIEQYLRESCQLSIEKCSSDSEIVYRYRRFIPLMKPLKGKAKRKHYCTLDELFEYIGLLVLDADLKPIEYVNDYQLEGLQQKTKLVSIINGKGLITPNEIKSYINRLVNLVNGSDSIQWAALHVQGYSNTPLDFVGPAESGICWNHDRACTVIITNQGEVLWTKLFGCSL